MFIQEFSDRWSTYLSNWMNENQVYFHVFVYIATVIISPYVTQEIVIPVECCLILISS